MRYLLAHFILSTTLLAGCNVQTGVTTPDSVIPKSADRDFGFAGTWTPEPNPEFDANTERYTLMIKQTDTYTATITDVSDAAGDKMVVHFRTHEISKQQPHANSNSRNLGVSKNALV